MKHTKTPAVRADPGYEAVLAYVVGFVAAARRAGRVRGGTRQTPLPRPQRAVRAGIRLTQPLENRIPQAPPAQPQVPAGTEKVQTASALLIPESAAQVGPSFHLPWSHYVRLLAVRNPEARSFYEAEALRGGWSIRQLDRQIDSQFYERTALSRNKAAMLRRGETRQPEDVVTPSKRSCWNSEATSPSWGGNGACG